MINKVFAIRDTKAEAFMQPFFTPAAGIAIRMFTDLVNDGKSTAFKYPDDFVLFEIGQFDDATGVISPLACPINLGLGSAFKNVNGGGN